MNSGKGGSLAVGRVRKAKGGGPLDQGPPPDSVNGIRPAANDAYAALRMDGAASLTRTPVPAPPDPVPVPKRTLNSPGKPRRVERTAVTS
jgi:hypothetical protein